MQKTRQQPPSFRVEKEKPCSADQAGCGASLSLRARRAFHSLAHGEEKASILVQRLNTAAVRLAMDVGNKKVIEAARALGITSPLPDVPSLALGTADVNLLELTAAYAGVLAGKAPIEPFGVRVHIKPRCNIASPAATSRTRRG